MSYRATIEKVLCYLFKDSETLAQHQDQIQVLDLLDTITDGEISGVDYALVKFVDNLYKILIGTSDYSLRMPIESVERILETSIQTLVYEDKFKVELEIRENGLGFDLTNPKGTSDMISYFYDEMITSIQEIYNGDVGQVQARAELKSLQEQICDVLFRTASIAQGTIYNKEGFSSAFETMGEYYSKIQRLKDIDVENDSSGNVLRLVSYDVAQKFDTRVRGKIKKLFTLGIEPYDEKFSITNNDVVGVTAPINIGKTRFCMFETYRCLMAGVNCTCICTETPIEVVKTGIELVHMYALYKYRELTPETLKNILLIEDANEREKYATLIDQYEGAIVDLYSNPKYGKLNILDSCDYETCRETFLKEKNVYNSEMIFIDHIRALTHNGVTPEGKKLLNDKDSLMYIAEVMRDLRVHNNIGFFIFSHPNASLSGDISDAKLQGSTNTTGGATEIAQSCTRMFYLSQTIEQMIADHVTIRETKAREEGKTPNSIVLMRMGASNYHIYNEKLQTSGNEELDRFEDLV